MACEVGQQLLQKNQDLEQTRSALQEELTTIKEELQKQKRANEVAVAAKEDYEKKLSDSVNDTQRLQETVLKLRQQLRKTTGAQDEAESLRREVSDLDLSKKSLEVTLKSANKKLQNLSGERQTLWATIQELYDQTEKFININRDLKSSCQKQIAEYTNIISKLQEEKLEMALNNSSSSEKKADDPSSTIESQAIQTLLKEIQTSTLSILQQKENADMEALKARLAGTEAENAEFLELIMSQQDSIHALQEERTTLETLLVDQQQGKGPSSHKEKRMGWMKSLRSEILENDSGQHAVAHDDTKSYDQEALQAHVAELGAQLAKQSRTIGEQEWKLREKEGLLAKASNDLKALEAEKIALKEEAEKIRQQAPSSGVQPQPQQQPVDSNDAANPVVFALKKETASLIAEVNAKKTELEKAKAEISDLRTKFDASTKSAKDLSETLASEQQRAAALQQKVREMEANQELERENISKAVRESQQLANMDQDSLKATALKQCETIAELEKKVESLQKEKETLQDYSSSLGSQLARQSSQIGKLEWQLRDVQKSEEKESAADAQQASQLKDLKVANEDLKDQVAALKTERDQLLATLNTLPPSLPEVTVHAKKEVTIAEFLQEKNEETTADITKLELAIQEKEEEIRKLNNQLSSERLAAANKIRDLEQLKRIAKHDHAVAASGDDMRTTSSSPSSKDRSESVEMIFNNVGKAARLDMQLKSVKRQKDEVADKMHELEVELEQAKKDLDDAKKQLAASNEIHVRESMERANMASKIANLQKELSDMVTKRTSTTATPTPTPPPLSKQNSKDDVGGLIKFKMPKFGRKRQTSEGSATLQKMDSFTTDDKHLDLLSKENEKLHVQVKLLSEENAKCMSETSRLMKIISDTESSFEQERADARAKLKEAHNKLKAMVASHKDVEECLQSQVQELTDRLMEPRSIPEDIQGELIQLKSKLDITEQSQKTESIRAADLEQKLNEARERCMALQKNLNILSTELSELRNMRINRQPSSNDVKKDASNSNVEEVTNLKAKVDELQASVSLLNSELEVKRGQLDDAHKATNKLKENNLDLTQSIENLEMKNKELLNAQQQLSDEKKGLIEKITALQSRMHSFETMVNDLRADFDIKQAKYASIKERYDVEIQTLTTELAKFKSAANTSDEALIELKAALAGRESHVQALTAELEKLKTTATVAHEEVDSLKAALTLNEKERQAMTTVLESMTAAFHTAQEEIKGLKAALAAHAQDEKSLVDKFEKFQAAATKAEEELNGLRATLNSKEEELKGAKGTISQTEETVRQLEERLNVANAKIGRLESNLQSVAGSQQSSAAKSICHDCESKEGQIAELNIKLQSQLRQFETISLEHKSLKEEVGRLEGEKAKFEAEIQQLRNSLSLSNDEVGKLAKALDLIQNEAEKRNLQLQSQLDEASASKKLNDEALASIQKQLLLKETETFSLKEKTRNLTAEKDRKESELLDLKSQYIVKEETLKDLKKKMDGILGEMKALETESVKLKQTVDDQHGQLEMSRKQLQQAFNTPSNRQKSININTASLVPSRDTAVDEMTPTTAVNSPPPTVEKEGVEGLEVGGLSEKQAIQSRTVDRTDLGQSLLFQNTELEERCLQYEKELETSERYVENLQREYAEMATASRKMKFEITTLATSEARLREALSASEQSNAEINYALSTARKQLKSAVHERSNLSKVVSELTNRNEELNYQNEQLQKTIVGLKRRVQTLIERKLAERDPYDDLEADNEQLKMKSTEVERETEPATDRANVEHSSRTATKVVQFDKERPRTLSRKNSMKSNLMSSVEIQSVQSENRQLREQLAELTAKLNLVEAEKDALRLQVSNLEGTVREYQEARNYKVVTNDIHGEKAAPVQEIVGVESADAITPLSDHIAKQEKESTSVDTLAGSQALASPEHLPADSIPPFSPLTNLSIAELQQSTIISQYKRPKPRAAMMESIGNLRSKFEPQPTLSAGQMKDAEAVMFIMKGSWLLKYTRKGGKHLRYVNVHPFKRVLSWHTRAVGSKEANEKSATMQSFEAVDSDGDQYILIMTKERKYRFEAETEEEHAIWVKGLQAILRETSTNNTSSTYMSSLKALSTSLTSLAKASIGGFMGSKEDLSNISQRKSRANESATGLAGTAETLNL
ncbi:hypothetical protein HDV05_003495 [Chytridiales sp. JEL 0842]|nr:hypothetical protein HDV05_003495 [Chytridiales sp. JEL 0842]